MQKNFDETESNPSGQKTFSIFEKNQALKILVDYSLVTGKKWQAILSEIFRVTGTQTTDHAPLLTRQDLEQWARRKNNIGDAKFQIIFNFLTHPETLARPEFSKASNLEKHGATKRTGHAFEQFFDNHKNLYYLTLPERKEIRISEYMDKFEGYYSGTDPRGRWYLAVTRYPHTNFFRLPLFSLSTSTLSKKR
ncbi:hypothetical protein [uncultured Cohaesibacter sp.]|uniref:hypothetical protein n=1 Tax=uncultured Cohaesibacter sp. TaxID=1002546 RepID=UPI00293094B0|nr:hypothetical protein [uncultured Cohaesibacter sp.]